MRRNVLEDRLTITRRNNRSKTSENGKKNSDPIPVDLIFEILLRLPAKSIARCRCVSKLWASTLRRPDFTELFLTKSSGRPQLLFACVKNGELLFFSSPQIQNPDENSSLVAANYGMKFAFDVLSEISGLVCGLVCLTHRRILKRKKETVSVICNPSTGQSLTLPKLITGNDEVRVMSFFGYDPIEKQFKVLYMTWRRYGRVRFSKEHQVVTLGTGKLSWKMIECSRPHYPACQGICINGVLYYKAYVQGFVGNYGIACFDIRSDKFKFIEANISSVILVNYRGKIATLKFDNVYGAICRTSRSFDLSILTYCPHCGRI